MNIDNWVIETEDLLQKLLQIDFGYPLGENFIRSPKEISFVNKIIEQLNINEANEFKEFYLHCDGLNLPDIHNGYFLDSLTTIIDGIARGEPTSLIGHYMGKIIVFGSDGGGGKFALRKNYFDIIYLPVGLVQFNIFDGTDTEVKYLAESFDIFLRRLMTDIKAFVYGYSNHIYLTDYSHNFTQPIDIAKLA